MARRKLTAKQERFCLEMIKPKATQIKAYKVAFDTQGMKRATIDNEAYKLMQDPEITARINALMEPVIARVRVTREQWLEKMQAFFYADIRKMFDRFGNPIEIPNLGDHESAMVEGFEFCEEYTNVKKADGSTQAVPTGYTKKYKLTPKLKAMLEFGRVMGWCDSDDQLKGPQRIFIRTWAKEEHHVHLHAGMADGIDERVHDGRGASPVSGGAAVETSASGRSGTTRPAGGADGIPVSTDIESDSAPTAAAQPVPHGIRRRIITSRVSVTGKPPKGCTE